MPKKSPGPRVKALGDALRVERNRAGVRLVQAAHSLGVSKTVMSRLEIGQRNITREEVVGLCTLYAVPPERREMLLRMVQGADDPGWWELEFPGLTMESATLADYEDRATTITSWAPLLIPGLLQTPETSRRFMIEDSISPGDVELRLMARSRRKQRLGRGDVRYLAIIGEPALAGRGDVHRRQLTALVEAAQQPNIDIRVVRTEDIPMVGRLGAFLLLKLATQTVVHVELARSGAFLDDVAFTDPYERSLKAVVDVALDATESVSTIVGTRDDVEP